MWMRTRDLLSIAALLGAAHGVSHAQPPQTANEGVDCITVSEDALYRGMGYDHLVYVRNLCEHAVSCDVSTNVQPEPERVEIPAGESTTVVTFRGSPASTFEPDVRCERVE